MADEFKVQLNVRGPKDTLYNVRADDVEELESILARLRESGDPAVQTMMALIDDGRAPKPKLQPKNVTTTKPRAVVKSVPLPKDDEEDETEEDDEEDEDEEEDEESEDEDAPTPNQIRAAKRLGITGYSKLTSKELEEKLTESFKRR